MQQNTVTRQNKQNALLSCNAGLQKHSKQCL